MKCPICAAWSNVLDTRGATRRRECGNGHRFKTVERITGTTARPQKWARNLRVVNDPRGASEIARELGITEAAVRYIRKTHAPVP